MNAITVESKKKCNRTKTTSDEAGVWCNMLMKTLIGCNDSSASVCMKAKKWASQLKRYTTAKYKPDTNERQLSRSWIILHLDSEVQ